MGESIPRPKASEVSPARAAHSATAPTRSELQISRSLSSWSKPPTSTISSVTQRNAENREPASAGTTRTAGMEKPEALLDPRTRQFRSEEPLVGKACVHKYKS